MTIEELIHSVQEELTVGCMLPKILPDTEIQRIVDQRALKYFWKNYNYAQIKVYYWVPSNTFKMEPFTSYKYIDLPEELLAITWVYGIDDRSLFSLGVSAPNLSINMGVTNQPYLTSFVTTVGELGVYKTIIDGFSDVLNQLSKHTYKYDFNPNNHQLNILTKLDGGLIIEGYCRIEAEALFEDELFYRYVVGLSRRQLGYQLSMFDFNLPGGVKYSAESIKTLGEEEITKVEDTIKGMSKTSFIFMTKR
jgi:hypothetical protein